MSLSYDFCEPVYWPVRPANRWLLRSNLQLGQTENRELRARLRDGPCAPDFSVLARQVARSASITQTTGKGLKGVWLVVLCFPNFSKARKLMSWKWSSFKLLSQKCIGMDFSCINLAYSCMYTIFREYTKIFY